MIIDGIKYACEACIKGHRVSGCNHGDRPLKVIAPKGRPVKQCEHCRVARKSKSHHTKCDCGEKKDKAKAAAKGEVGVDINGGAQSDLLAVDAHGCHCHHGAKCICGVKVDALDPISETQPLKLQHHAAKPRPGLSTAHSESTLTVFANGHHKPCHRFNNTAHTSGAPYKIPRPHSLHASSHTQQEQSERLRREAYNGFQQRSMDDLLLSNTSPNNPFGPLNNAQRSVDSLPITPLTGNFESGFDSDFLNFASQKLSSTAPQTSAGLDYEDNPLTKTVSHDSLGSQSWLWIDPTTTTGVSQIGLESLATSPTGDFYPGYDSDWAIPSAGLDIFGPADLPLHPDQLAGGVTQPVSHSGESNHHSAPALTASSSGAQSEVGEAGLFGDLDPLGQQHTCEPRVHGLPFRLNQAHQESDLSRPQSSAADGDNRRSLDLTLLRRTNDDLLLQDGLNYDSLSQSVELFPTLLTTSPGSVPRSNPTSMPAPLQRATSFPDLGVQGDVRASLYPSADFISAVSAPTSEPRSITIPADPVDGDGASNNWYPDLGLGYNLQIPFQTPEEPSWL